MKYKVGDKVRIKNKEWYEDNCNRYGILECGDYEFFEPMNEYCGEVVTITRVDDCYRVNIDKGAFCWTDEMIEGFVEDESEKKLSDESWKPSKEEMDVLYGLAYITNKYDEHKEEVITRLYQDLKREFFNGSSYENMFPNTENDVRRRSTIQVLEYARSLDNYNQYGKEDIDKNIAWLEKQGKSALEARTNNELVEEEVGLVEEEDLIPKFGEYSDNEPLDVPTMTTDFVKEHGLPCPEGYIFKDENGNVINATKIVLEKKKKEYPKTFRECCKILDIDSGCLLGSYDIGLWKDDLLGSLQNLLICRDAYWKIAGEEMGLGKPWQPDWSTENNIKYVIEVYRNNVRTNSQGYSNTLLAFPTPEMRDVFYENFKGLIESCKELL